MVCICLAVITGAVFSTAVSHDFVNYDDRDYVTRNYNVRAGLTLKGVVYAFKTKLQGHWHPLTFLSHMLDCQLFGLNPAGHHATSILFHIFNTILLFLLLEKMTKMRWPSALVAALFALHPMHVESVAWISERKDVLSTFFMLLTFWVYVSYTKHPGPWKYLLSLIMFALGLLSKSMIVTLPFILILLDYWPLGRLLPAVTDEKGHPSWSRLWKHKILREKLPFLLLSLIDILIILAPHKARWTHKTHSVMPFADRLIHTANGYAMYVWKMFWPMNLSIAYQKTNPVFNWQTLLAVAFLMGVSVLSLWNIKKRPYLIVGWLWYLGMIVPVSGILIPGPHFALADRYTYAAFIGIFIMLSWGILEVADRNIINKKSVAAAMVLFLGFLSFLTVKQIGYWKNSITLFSHALEVNENNVLAHVNLGLALHNKGNDKEAMEHLKRAIQLNPNNEKAQYGIGFVLSETGQYQKAVDYLKEAIRLNPGYAMAHVQLGVCLAQMGKFNEARPYFTEAIRINPKNSRIYYNYGNALGHEKKYKEALEQIQKALDIDPNYGLARLQFDVYRRMFSLDRGIQLYEEGRLKEADDLLKEIVRRSPQESSAYLYLGLIASSRGRLDLAISNYRNAVRISPGYTEAYVNLGIALTGKKEYVKAEKAFLAALKINPDYAKAHYNYAIFLYLQQRYKESMEHLDKTLEIDPDNKQARDALKKIKGLSAHQ